MTSSEQVFAAEAVAVVGVAAAAAALALRGGVAQFGIELAHEDGATARLAAAHGALAAAVETLRGNKAFAFGPYLCTTFAVCFLYLALFT